MTEQNQPKNWRRMLADLGGYENGLINIPAAGVIPIIDEVEALRAKLNELEKQEPSYFLYPNGRCGLPGRPPLDAGHADATVLKLYLAAGARPVEPVQKLRPDFIAGYDAGMADAKRIQAAQPAPAERTGCELGCTTECKAKAHGCASECPALPWQPKPAPAAVVGPTNKVLWLLNFGRDVWNAALSTIQPTAQQERIHDQIAAEVAMAADKRRPT